MARPGHKIHEIFFIRLLIQILRLYLFIYLFIRSAHLIFSEVTSRIYPSFNLALLNVYLKS